MKSVPIDTFTLSDDSRITSCFSSRSPYPLPLGARGLGEVILESILRTFALAVAALVCSSAMAQRGPRDPHLAYAFPAGAQQGTSYDITLGGQHLENANEAYISGEGAEVEILSWYRPLTRGEYNKLRMALGDARKQLVEQRKKSGKKGGPSEEEVAMEAGVTAEQLRQMEIFRERDRDKKRQPNDQLEEEVTLRLTVADDAEPGKRELRLLSDTSMSNPIWLHIGQWPEVYETEPNDNEPDTAIKQMPIVVNGQIMPGETDTFAFTAKKGDRLVIQAAARDVIPYLADAVPGWFQAVMTIADADGNELTYADSFHFRQDPVIYFEVPHYGEYILTIRDSLYRGREDFVYRITIGELPFITSMFPLGGRAGSEVTVQLEGWNLSQSQFEINSLSAKNSLPIRWFSVPQEDGTSVRFPLKVDRLPEILDKEPNNEPETSQDVSVRKIINGRIDYPGDVDIYRIEGWGKVVAEVHARRHGSPLDSVLSLTDASGKEVAFNDDHEDRSQAFLTHHADSHLEAVIPSKGTYYLHIRDVQRNGGDDFIYRLYVRPPEPDYELRVTPSSIVARAGAVVPITVFALRKDGFDKDIYLGLMNGPPGFQLSGGVIPGNADHVTMTLTMPKDAPAQPVVLNMEGRSRLGRTDVVARPAIPAENMMQAFIWHHLVPVEFWSVIVNGKPGAKPPFEIQLLSDRVHLPLGEDVFMAARLTSKNIKPDELRVDLKDPPPGISAEIVTDQLGRFAVKLTADPETAEQGLRGNLLLFAYREWTPPATDKDPNPKERRTDYGYFPAFPFEIAGAE